MTQLYIANKNYSSWSLRPWVLMRMLDIAFKERLVPFGGDADAYLTGADVEDGHSCFLSVRSSRRRRRRHCGNCLSSAADFSHPALSISGNTPE